MPILKKVLPLLALALEQYNAWVLERQCLKSRIRPEDVADLALFLCSDAARMISGHNIAIDGGW